MATAAPVARRPPVEILADALVRIGPATNSNEAAWTSVGSFMEPSDSVTLHDAEDIASHNTFLPWSDGSAPTYRFW
jgi:hypothetical protein